jgi:hypothetical protein
MTHRLTVLAIGLLGLAVPAGCSSRPTTVTVAGSVRYEGHPLDNGEIRFIPDEGTAAPTNGSRIVAGRYSVTARGGLLPGRYRVEIESRPTAGNELAMPEEGEGQPKPPVKIPARYNSASTLEAEIGPEPPELTLDYDLTAG